MRDALDRFAEKYTRSESGCWLWNASRFSNGYSQFRVGYRMQTGHSFAYEYFVGTVPEGKELHHLCGIRHCVNPDHLVVVTHLENVRQSGNAIKTHCKHGHKFTLENTYVWEDHKGLTHRLCKTCREDNR